MQTGLFLDVDMVLTPKAINLQYASLLGIENDLIELERRFANQEITNDQFNAEFIPLFRKANFTREFARQNAANIQLSINADHLLTSPNTFLITSGPSYFIECLAEKYKIQKDHILCSVYEFDAEGLLCRCVRPVNSTVKGMFVQERAAGFDISIGVGDSEQDIEFLSHCNVRIMMEGNRSRDYLLVRELQPVLNLVSKLQTGVDRKDRRHERALFKLFAESRYEQNIFVMTPFRKSPSYRETIRSIQEALKEVGLRGWLASDLNLEHQLWDNVEAFLIGCRAGIAVFTHDYGSSEGIGQPNAVFNPNVSIEVGYLLSRAKPVLLLKEKGLKTLPTDMVGFLYTDFDLDNAENTIRAAVSRWARNLI